MSMWSTGAQMDPGSRGIGGSSPIPHPPRVQNTYQVCQGDVHPEDAGSFQMPYPCGLYIP